LDYMIVIHPPLVLENLLPEACVFRLYDFTSKAMLWKAHLQAGQSMPIHDVRVDCSVLLDVQTE
ncbi:vacuolar protein sorting-associated protein vps13, partial [Nannochloropsis gaditana CCMP526]